MNKVKKNGSLFLLGGTLYPIIEILWRGYSHISMAFAGGVCVVLINKFCCEIMKGKSIILKAFTGGSIITAVEFFTGLFINKFMGLKVWDYSSAPFNLLGQICLPFTFLWTALSVPVIFFCKWFTKVINK